MIQLYDGDPESFGPWIRDGKIQIREKNLGSATLLKLFVLDPLCNDDIKHPPMTVLYVTGFFCVYCRHIWLF